MHETNLQSVDLNLLVVFDTVMRERHVGRAAEALRLTQPAVSHALARLRHLFGDPLFVKHPKGVRPTSRAEDMAAPLAVALQALRAAIGGASEFDPVKAKRTIVIGATDYVGLTLMPPLMAALRDAAPGIDVRQRATSRDTVVHDMRRQEIDLAIGPLEAATPAIEVTPLFGERLVLVARRGHKALRKSLTPKAFAALPHLLVSPRGDPFGSVDEVLREAGLARRVVLTVPHFLTAPFVVGATDLVAVLAERVAHRLADAAGISLGPLPVALRPWTVGLGRLKDAPADPALDWMAKVIARVAAEI